jgi:hypothetical protein
MTSGEGDVMGVSRTPRYVVPILVAASVLVAPVAAADPPSQDGVSAADTIAALQDEGYDVQINWVRGPSSVPLSQCLVTGENNPNRSGGPPIGFTTVYVDVSCPDDDDDSGIGFGLGFG